MNTKLTLQEKLRDLREEKNMRLADVVEATGIPASTLQRFESDKDVRVGYQDIEVLTRFYDVSADYLFGITGNRQYRNVEIDKLMLSDEAIAQLVSGKLNNRLLSLLISHPDFAELLAALEVFVDRTISENMKAINQIYKVAVDAINKEAVTVGRDEYLATLKEVSIDPDDYMRFRLARRFEKIAQSLYDTHKPDIKNEAGKDYLEKVLEQIEIFKSVKKETGSKEQAKLAMLADQMGIDLNKVSEDEKQFMLNFMSRSKFPRFFRKRK